MSQPATLSASSEDFWNRKLSAFLHDDPTKPLDIARHETAAEASARRSGNTDADGRPVDFDREADWTAAAADRLPFPQWAASGVRCAYDSDKNPFRHPLCGVVLSASHALTAEQAQDIAQNTQPVSYDFSVFRDPVSQARARFIAHWRLWSRHAEQAHAAFAALPADTRIPDHTVWTHIGLVSAFEGATHKGDQPALLKFQLGPVQDFIAAARSTRDLWSGSYLLSWLMSAGLVALANEIGPDAVIFPNLHGQPLLDLRWRRDLWEKLNATGQEGRNVWTDLQATEYRDRHSLLTANLPNVFLALVPNSRAAALACLVESAIRKEWREIAEHVRTFSEPLFELRRPNGQPDSTRAADADGRFRTQVDRHLEIAWQATPFPNSTEALIELAARHLPGSDSTDSPVHRVRRLVRYFTTHVPTKHRDRRFYLTPECLTLNNIGVAWSLAVALNGWQLDATRSLRRFDGLPASGGKGNQAPDHGAKDALNGRDAMLFGGNAEWHGRVQALGQPWQNLFRHPDEVGAITLIKRTWHLAHLRDHWGLPPLGMPNTHQIAAGQSEETYEAEECSDTPSDSQEERRYYAILAFDGDSIGAWVSGAASPTFGSQLARHCHREGKLSPWAYFEQLDREQHIPQAENLLDLPRPLSPSYHLQFSAALTHFALHCAHRVVHAHGGRLLYAGGDDVLAMVPAVHSLACADDLQRVFRGLSPSGECGITPLEPGFLAVTRDRDGRPIPVIMPGPRATASVGLAIAHFSQPLQDVVRAARRAEARAKRLPGKHGLAVSLFKRSGEITEWATRFDAEPDTTNHAHRGGLQAALLMLHALGADVASRPGAPRAAGDPVLSSRFPYRLAELLEPHCSEDADGDFLSDKEVFDLVGNEARHVMDRQRGPAWSAPHASDTRERLVQALLKYLGNLPGKPSDRLRSLIGLLATVAFLARQPSVSRA